MGKVGTSVRVKILGGGGIRRTLDPGVALASAASRMDIIIADAASRLSEATAQRGHVGIYGNLKGAWLQHRGVERSSTAIIGYSDPTPSAPYAWYVIYGTKPFSKHPPMKPLLVWVRKKLGLHGKDAFRAAFAIARRFRKYGMPPHDFVTPVVKENKEFWARMLIGGYDVSP